MGYGGKPINLPREGDPAVPGALYVARCRFGYGDTARTAGGASDGCNVWADTQCAITSDAIPVFRIAAVDSDMAAPASDDVGGKIFGGVLIHDMFSAVKVAFTASVTLCVFTTDGADSDQAWLTAGQVGCTQTGYGLIGSSDLDTGFGMLGHGPRLYDSSDVVDIFVESSGADIAAGIVDIFCVYSYADQVALADTNWPDTLAG